MGGIQSKKEERVIKVNVEKLDICDNISIQVIRRFCDFNFFTETPCTKLRTTVTIFLLERIGLV